MATITFASVEERVAWRSAIIPNCKKCGSLTEYNEKYDAHFCPLCNLWAEAKCSAPDCEFCVARPELPSEVVR